MTQIAENKRSLTTMDDPAVRVHDAAQWLDAGYPGWADKVDLDDFDMLNCDKCIGGYLGVAWDHTLGDNYKNETGNSQSGLFSSFDEEWREEILARRG